ncbi:hypothetical protein ACFL08_01180 [Patescibacteria group bacterium]
MSQKEIDSAIHELKGYVVGSKSQLNSKKKYFAISVKPEKWETKDFSIICEVFKSGRYVLSYSRKSPLNSMSMGADALPRVVFEYEVMALAIDVFKGLSLFDALGVIRGLTAGFSRFKDEVQFWMYIMSRDLRGETVSFHSYLKQKENLSMDLRRRRSPRFNDSHRYRGLSIRHLTGGKRSVA